MRSAEKIGSVTGEGKKRVGGSEQKDTSYHHGLRWVCLSRMVVSSLAIAPHAARLQRENER